MIMENKICTICGRAYASPPAVSRLDNITPVCPECGTRQALDAAGINGTEQEKIIQKIYHPAS